MTKINKLLKLTQRELDVMNILWSSKTSLVASDITKIDDTLSLNTVQAVLRNLLNKKLIEVVNIVYSGTVLTRSYQPTISLKDFTLKQFIDHFKILDKSITTHSLVATLLEHEKNEAAVIDELEELLKKRRKMLKKDDLK